MNINKLIRKENGSVTLWIAISLPLLVMLFMFLFLRITSVYNIKRYVQNVGDLSANAAAMEVNTSSMFIIPPGETQPIPQLDEVEAVSTAQTYLKENLTSAQSFITSDVNSLVDENILVLDPSTNRPMNATDEGIAIRVLNNNSYINPITGDPVTSPSVLIVMQLRINAIMGTELITSYSIASL